jgi:hypothetical protein
VYLGIAGGLINCLLVDKRFILPRVIHEGDETSISPGFFANLIFGAVAGLITYFYGRSDIPQGKLLGLAVMAGVAGANFFLGKLETAAAKSRAKTMRSAAERAITKGKQ